MSPAACPSVSAAGLGSSDEVPVAAWQPVVAPLVRSDIETARGALGRAVTEVGGTQVRAAHDSQELDDQGDEGGAFGRLYGGDRRTRRRERGAWEVHGRARDAVYTAAGDYARALRDGGVLLPAALAAVRTTVAGSKGLLATPPSVASKRFTCTTRQCTP